MRTCQWETRGDCVCILGARGPIDWIVGAGECVRNSIIVVSGGVAGCKGRSLLLFIIGPMLTDLVNRLSHRESPKPAGHTYGIIVILTSDDNPAGSSRTGKQNSGHTRDHLWYSVITLPSFTSNYTQDEGVFSTGMEKDILPGDMQTERVPAARPKAKSAYSIDSILGNLVNRSPPPYVRTTENGKYRTNARLQCAQFIIVVWEEPYVWMMTRFLEK